MSVVHGTNQYAHLDENDTNKTIKIDGHQFIWHLIEGHNFIIVYFPFFYILIK